MNQSRPGSHFPVSADADAVGFSSASHHGKRGHGCSKYGHQQEKWPDRTAGDKEVVGSTPEKAGADLTQNE